MFTLEKLSFVENVWATTAHLNRLTDTNIMGIIGMGLGLVKEIILQKLLGKGEFQGGKNDKFYFQFQKPPVEFFRRIR